MIFFPKIWVSIYPQSARWPHILCVALRKKGSRPSRGFLLWPGNVWSRDLENVGLSAFSDLVVDAILKESWC